MSTLSITNFFSLPSQGSEKTGKQGSASSDPKTPFDVTVSGTGHFLTGSLATATARTIYDDDDDAPSDFNYTHFWSDQNCYIQLIFASTNVVLPVLAKVPFCLAPLTAGLVGLAAANTTPITGGAEPTLTDLDSVVIANYSGTTMNFTFAAID